MKNYVIYNKNEKKSIFENFKRTIINLLNTHNVFFIIGRLKFDEFIKLVLILYEKKLEISNDRNKICVAFNDNILTYCYNIIEEDSKDFFYLSSEYDEEENDNSNTSNKIAVFDESTLLQKILFDPLLIEFNIIILTNTHKRLIKTDLLLSLLKKILTKRNDLHIFIFSDYFIENVLNFFKSCNSVHVSNPGKKTSIGSEKEYEKKKDDQIRGMQITNNLKEDSGINVAEPKRDEAHKRICDVAFENFEKNDKVDIIRKGNESELKDSRFYKENVKNSGRSNSNSSDNYSEEHVYWGNRDKIKYKKQNEKKSERERKEINCVKNKELNYLINNKKKLTRSRSNTLSSEMSENGLNALSSSDEIMYTHSSNVKNVCEKKMQIGKNKEQNKDRNKKNVLNCFFVNESKHSLMYNYEEEEITKGNTDIDNEEMGSKLEEWKELTSNLEKIKNPISIFIFHILPNNYYYDDNCVEKNKQKEEFDKHIHYLKESCSDYLQTSIMLIKNLYENNKRKKGSNENILIFLNNEYEIYIVKKGLQSLGIDNIEVINDNTYNYDSLEVRNQIVIIKDIGFSFHKVKYVKYIIDTCFMKDEIYDYDLNMTNKYTILCNKNKCEDRRLAYKDSICFRLITMNDYMDLLNDDDIPEILKKDIFYKIFYIKTLGINNICSFDFVTAPTIKALKKCFEMFYILNLMDINGNIIDKKLSLLICYLPLKFKYSIFLINSIKYKCVYEVCIIISMLINDPIFVYNNNSSSIKRLKVMRLSLMAEESDILSFYNIFQSFVDAKNKKKYCHDNFLNYTSLKKAERFFNKLKYILNKFGIPMEKCENIESIFKAKISSFYYNVAKVVNDNKYKLLNKKSENILFSLDPLSILNESNHTERKFIVYIDLYSNNDSEIFMKHASIIDALWLTSVCPIYFSNKHMKAIQQLE
ncbi:conserved protein, unknown function [Plasmodium vinckei brucechwatti]|uniref:DEAD-box helicase OB fold domain-containing protein n=1 Tax=Plasmodium vinckei brucechwatti TaxID=119398 RepID=A0A6V7SNJ5_PLAVN|nr:conserved protein, unknown function [Plasmodium vinckei brucechwatti]